MPEPVEPEVATARRSFLDAQAALDAPTRTTLADLVTVGWHDTSVHPERGSFAVVARDGPLTDLIGELLRVSARGRSVIVYCMASADVPFDLSLARRAMVPLTTLARSSMDCTIEVLG